MFEVPNSIYLPMKTLTFFDVLKLLVGIVTILAVAIKLIVDFKQVKKILKELIKNKVSKKPGKKIPALSFAEIIIYALVSTFLGGITYNLIFDGTMGGSGKEPHGLDSLLWGALTNIFSFIFLLAINKRISNIPLKRQLIIYGAFIIGLSLGGWIFYNIPIAGQTGIRAYIEYTYAGCTGVEGYIAILWSGIISIAGFTLMYLAKILVGYTHGIHKILAGLITAVVSTIIIVTISILCHVTVFHCDPYYDSSRGIIAAIALRTVLFINIVNSQLYGQKVDFPVSWKLLDQLKSLLSIKSK